MERRPVSDRPDFIDSPTGGRYVNVAIFADAITEIYELRAALAYEADVRRADLELRSYPKTRRGFAEIAIERMQEAARGSRRLYWGLRYPKHALRTASAADTLTNSEWLAARAAQEARRQ
jgi:hypothetical protein